MIYVFLAEGFEEIEAITIVDVLRRAEYPVTTVAVGTTEKTVVGAHGIPVVADITEATLQTEHMEAVILPGGMPGTLHLDNAPIVQVSANYCAANGKLLAAICAAPSVLGHLGLLEGKEATCYPGFEQELYGAKLSDAMVVQDGQIITGKGPGAAIAFALQIVQAISGKEKADEIGMGMQCL